jgi:hypothetical protein
MKKFLLFLSATSSIIFAHTGRECPTCGYDQMPMWQGMVFGTLMFIVACFVFSIIFWSVYKWVLKAKKAN